MQRCATPKAKNSRRRMCRPQISHTCVCARKSIQRKSAKRWKKESRGSPAAATFTFISSTKTRRRARYTQKTSCQQLKDDKLKDVKNWCPKEDSNLHSLARTRT